MATLLPDPAITEAVFVLDLKLVRHLGNGTFANAYLVKSRDDTKSVIKLIGEERCNNRYIAREVVSMFKLSHHYHINQLWEAIYIQDCGLCLSLEYFTDHNLEQYLRTRNYRISENDARVIFRQIALAIDYCHLRGICHRDISLKNILILHGENISAKICDFGWSKDPVIQSAMRTRAGTSLFAAPEVLNNTGESYTHKADCWSLGIVLYYLLFGVTPYTCLPYKRDDHDEIMNRAMQGTWSFPTEAAIQERRVSPGAKELIRKLLQKDPNQRCTAREILVDPWTFDTIEERDIAMQYNDNTVLFQRDHTVTGHRECAKLRGMITDTMQTMHNTLRMPVDEYILQGNF